MGLVNNLALIACFLSHERWGSQENLSFKTQLPYERYLYNNKNPYRFEANSLEMTWTRLLLGSLKVILVSWQLNTITSWLHVVLGFLHWMNERYAPMQLLLSLAIGDNYPSSLNRKP